MHEYMYACMCVPTHLITYNTYVHAAYCMLPIAPCLLGLLPIPYSLYPPLLIPYSLIIAYALFPTPPALPLFPPYCLFLVSYSSLVFVPYSLFLIHPLLYIPYSLSLFSPLSPIHLSTYLDWG